MLIESRVAVDRVDRRVECWVMRRKGSKENFGGSESIRGSDLELPLASVDGE
jgi:hypothetical protein